MQLLDLKSSIHGGSDVATQQPYMYNHEAFDIYLCIPPGGPMLIRRISAFVLILFAAMTAMMTAGCSGDGPVAQDPPDVIIPWPDTPDQLMEELCRAYREMNVFEYSDLLHGDFRFIFIDSVAVWGRGSDLQSTANMFAGNPGQDPETGEFREGVQSISLNTLTRVTPWEDVPADDSEFPNSEMAGYDVQIVFVLNGGENSITVESGQLFYVASESVGQPDGLPRIEYFLCGQRDFADGGPWKSNPQLSWGGVKSLF